MKLPSIVLKFASDCIPVNPNGQRLRSRIGCDDRLSFQSLEPRRLLASFFVAANGADTNAGTINAPFQSIQHAANAMASGDTAFIRGGTYRETVNVTKHDLTFEAYDDEYVVVTGADLVTGWTHYGGEVYTANFGAIEPEFTQVFLDGARQQIARYPDNQTGDMLSIDDSSGYADLNVLADGTVTFDSPPPGGIDQWVGGYVRAVSGYTWANPTGLITASNGATLTTDRITKAWEDGLTATLGDGKGYILHLDALSTAGEWYYLDNTLYYWKPGGGQPTDFEVEAQRRESAFVANGFDGLTLRSLHIRAADVQLLNSDNNLIEGSTFQHLKGWYTRRGYGSSPTQLGGVVIDGDNNTIDSSVFEKSWGNLLNFADGNNNTVTNSLFRDNGWMSQFSSAIANYAYNTTVTHSTFGSTGRFHIRTWDKINILHNDFYDAMRMGQDAGSIQAVEIDLQGSEIAYNTVHDMTALPSFTHGKQYVVAFYLEGSSNYTVHHNLVYNILTPRIDGTFVYLGPRRILIENVLYYNNTVWDVDWRIRVWNRDGLGTVDNIQFKNNVFDSRAQNKYGSPDLGSQFEFANNINSSDATALFADQANANYQLASGSPAIDAGKVIPGITDGFTGTAPDAGAFETGVAPWEYGVNRLLPFYYDTGDDEYQTWLSGQLTPTQRIDPNFGGYLNDPGGNGLANVADYALGIPALSSELPVLQQTVGNLVSLRYDRKTGDRSGVQFSIESADGGSGNWTALMGVQPIVAPDGQGMESVTYWLAVVPQRAYRLAVSHLNGPGTETVQVNFPFTQPAPPLVNSSMRDEGGVLARPDLISTYVVSFDVDISVSADDLIIRNDTLGGTLVDSSTLVMGYNAATKTAEWDFSGLTLDAAFYSFELSDDIVSVAGNVNLDGDTNGIAGGDYVETIYVALPGDANLDGAVDVLGDATSLVNNLGTTAGAVWADGDFNGDGAVDVLGDATILVSRLGQSVVSMPAAFSAFATTSALAIADVSQPVSFTTDQTEQRQRTQLPSPATQLLLAGCQNLDAAFESINLIDDGLF